LLKKLLLRRLLQRGTLRVEVENALAEREALERVSRVEAENAVAFASICEVPKALSGRSPFLRTRLWCSVGPERCLR
jgi:hypothetical protein